HHFTGTDDVSHGWIDFRVDVLEVDFHDGVPGFLHVQEDLLQHHLHDTDFRRRELPPLDLGVTTVTAEEVVHQLEDQLGIQNEQAGATQWAQLHQIQAGRHIQGVNVLAELEDLNPARGDVRVAPQQIEQTDAGVA